MKKKFKSQEGITLIALVITIILMLILASITVTTIINGGLFNYAGKAKQDTEIASEKETLQKASIVAETTSKTGKITVEEMQEAINKVISEGTATAMNYGETIVVKYNESNRYYEIDKNGNVKEFEMVEDTIPGELDGTGTLADPYVIMSIEDLVHMSQQANENKEQYRDKYIILGKSLDFNSDLSYVNPSTTEYDEYLGGDGSTGLKEQLTNGNGFIPIGHTNWFLGNFNGNNNTIYNIYVETIQLNVGLFGTVNGGEISNLTITGNINGGGGRTGGILGYATNNCVISNCYNLCNVYGQGHTGGIVGWDRGSKIINCYNIGKVKLEIYSSSGEHEGVDAYLSTGGIVGQAENTCIINCYNLNTVENYCTKVYAGAGGILGNTVQAESIIVNCYNIGKTTGKYSQGSIVGGYWYNNWISKLDKCYYLEGTCDKPVGAHSQNITEGTILCTNEYMKSQEFVDELNRNIENGFQYEEENEEGETETITIDTTGCAKWVYNKNSYPTLDLGTIWNGSTWEKK